MVLSKKWEVNQHDELTWKLQSELQETGTSPQLSTAQEVKDKN